MAEHAAVNRRVVSSSLTRGAKIPPTADVVRDFPFLWYIPYMCYIHRTMIDYTSVRQKTLINVCSSISPEKLNRRNIGCR